MHAGKEYSNELFYKTSKRIQHLDTRTINYSSGWKNMSITVSNQVITINVNQIFFRMWNKNDPLETHKK